MVATGRDEKRLNFHFPRLQNGCTVGRMKVRKTTRRLPSGKVQEKWICDLGVVNGRRVREYFPSEKEAEAHRKKALAKRKAEGEAAWAMSDSDRVRFREATEKLATVGATIEQAVSYYVAHHTGLREPLRLADLLEAFILAKELEEKKRPRYVTQLGVSCRSFLRGRHDQLAHTMTRREIVEWIEGPNGFAGKTQKTYLGDVRSLFSWAMERGHVTSNPAAGKFRFRAPKEDSDIAALTNDQVRALLAIASAPPFGGRRRYDRPALLWFVALGFFCGIRPEELGRMGRELVNLEELTVIVPARSSKTRQRRVIDLAENAAAWLALDDLRAGPIVPPNGRQMWNRLRDEAGWRAPAWTHRRGVAGAREIAGPVDLARPAWPHDAARHTFASNHYALFQDEDLLKAQMGHSKHEDTLMQHYRALRTRAQAAEFWTLVPG